MRIPYRRRPSPGFVLVITVYLLIAAVLGWASSTPPLETVWRLDLELSLGARPPLTDGERALLQRSLAAHPDLGVFLVEDKHAGVFSANEAGKVEIPYAYLVRQSPAEPGELRVSYVGTKKEGAVDVRVRTATHGGNGLASPGAAFVWQLPDRGPFPQLVELRFENADGKEGKRHHPVQVDLVEPP
jgi:hypothetical protein